MKIKFSRELQIGILVIVTIAILYFGINYLKGINIFNPTNYYYAKFERVDGLVASNPVTIKGYKIGLVKSIIYNYDDPKDGILVVLQVDDQLRIPVGSKAVLQSELLGGASVSLDLHTEIPGVYFKRGDTIPTTIDGGIMEAVIGAVMPKIESVIPQLDSLIGSLNSLVEDGSIKKSLANVERITANLASTSASLDVAMKKDVPIILKNVKEITTDFSKISGDLSRVDFNATMLSVNHTMANLQLITDKVNDGSGSIGLLINDKSLYNNLNSTMESANSLLIDFKAHPKRYIHFSVFGKSDKK